MKDGEESAPGESVDVSDTLKHVPWRLGAPEAGESCRWVCTDGRWIALTIVPSQHPVRIEVRSSTGQVEIVASQDEALALARAWRR